MHNPLMLCQRVTKVVFFRSLQSNETASYRYAKTIDNSFKMKILA